MELTNFFIFFRFIFRERGREGGRQGEKHRCGKHRSVACHTFPSGDLTGYPGMCLDLAATLPCGDDAQPTEPH